MIKEMVYQLTEYPVDMMDSDTNIELDLGIDSIKKIQLIQNLMDTLTEEQRNQLEEKYSFSDILQLHTIGEFEAIFQTIKEGAEQQVEMTEPSDSTKEDRFLVKGILAQITGLSTSELESDMELEGDLGIDSIKKMEFLNMLLELISSEKKDEMSESLSYEQLLNLRTIQEFEDLLSIEEPLEEQELPISYSQYTFLMSYWAVGTMSLVSRVTCQATLDQEKLNQAWRLLVQMHPSLHARFEGNDRLNKLSEYKFIYLKEEDIQLNVSIIDLRGKNSLEQSKSINEFSKRIINSKFDIFEFPLHRFYVFELEENKFEVLLANTHLISDGLGNQILLRTFVELYHQLLQGNKVVINVAQKVHAYIEEVNKSLEWKPTKLDTIAESKKYMFPHQESEKEAEFGEIENQTFYLSSADTRILMRFANQHNFSFYNLLVSAYLYAIHQITKDPCVTLNLPTSGRMTETFDLKELIGCFAQNMSLTFELEGLKEKDPSLFIRYVQDKINASFLNQDDMRQGYWLTNQLIKQNLIKNGEFKKEFKEVVNISIKTNLYLSFVGDNKIYQDSDTLHTTAYKAYTGTNKNAIDILVEQFNETIMFSLNYDQNAYEVETIRELYQRIYQYLMMVRNYYSIQAEEPEEVKQVSNRNTIGEGAQREIVEEVTNLVAFYLPNQVDIDPMASLESTYGISSMDKMRLIIAIANQYKVTDMINIFKAQTIEDIVSNLMENKQEDTALAPTSKLQESDPVLLYSPAQLWQLRYFDPPYRWCGFSRFIYQGELDTEVLYQAVSKLLQQHDIFKMKFTKQGDRLVPSFDGSSEVSIQYYKNHLEEKSPEYENLVQQLIKEITAQLDLEKGNLFCISVIVLSDSRFEFITIGHHMLFDMISDQILFRNLWSNYSALLTNSNQPIRRTPSFEDYIRTTEQAYNEDKQAIDHYWEEELGTKEQTTFSFYNQKGSNLEQDKRKVSYQFSKEMTDQLLKVSSTIKGSSFYDVILAPLYEAIAHMNHAEKVTISHRMHGRYVNKKSYMETVGNFAVNYPVVIQMGNQDSERIISQIANKRACVPLNGLSYDLWGNNGAVDYPDHKATIVRANYLGRIDNNRNQDQFEIDTEKENQRYTLPEDPCESDIEFIFSMQQEQLCADIYYPSKRCNEKDIKALLEEYCNTINRYVGQQQTREKVAVVTGGSSGIGKATVEKYITDGYLVIILSKNKQKQDMVVTEFNKQYGAGSVKGYALDVTDYFEVQKVVRNIYATNHQIDALVCCAGITKMCPFDELTPTQWNQILDVNLQGTFNVLHSFVPYLKESKHGSIAIVGSDSSYIGYPLMSAYSASKHALVGLTKTLSEELKGDGININLVCPTLADTEMTPKAMQKEALATTEVANVIYAMTSELLSAVTGAVIPVEGKKDMHWFGIKQAKQIMPLLK